MIKLKTSDELLDKILRHQYDECIRKYAAIQHIIAFNKGDDTKYNEWLIGMGYADEVDEKCKPVGPESTISKTRY